MLRMRKTSFVGVLLAVLALVATLGTACSTSSPGASARATESTPSTEPAQRPAPPGPPTLAVKVDNVDSARPPVGLDAAEMVYVEPVEAGLSRIIGVFGEKKPEKVGPVRSARETDLRLLPQFGSPTLAFSGAAPELLPAIEQSPVTDGSPERHPDAYFRDASRQAPHDLMVNTAKLPEGGAWAPDARPQFGPAPEGGTPNGHHEVHYENASMAFDWAPERHQWNVSMDGEPYTGANGDQLGAPTVVLQKVNVRNSELSDSTGSVSPLAETVGKGTATVLRDGAAFEVNWSRPAPEAATTYTTPDGAPVNFAEGQVWTVLQPA